MSRILIASDVPMASEGGRMAGLQIRVHEMARALARRGHDVTVAAPETRAPAAISAGVRCVAPQDVGSASDFDAWIAHPFAAEHYFSRIGDVPYVMDGYEAPFASFMSHSAGLLPTLGNRVLHDYRNFISRFLRALERADRVLCANENQRLCYLSLLCVLGRINPRHPGEDMILNVQSGAPPERPPVRARRESGPVLLWAGGCYPWFDPESFLKSLPRVAAAVPDVRFVFAGIGGSGHQPEAQFDMPAARRVFDAVQASEDLRTRSKFVPWIPYADRGALYADADVAVCSYKRAIETTFSMRTRVIDLIWGGLPVVVTAGDAAGAVLAEKGAGRVVPAENPAALADAIIGLLKDPELRARMGGAAEKLAAGDWSWDAQIGPLDEYCRNPTFLPGRKDESLLRTVRGMVRIGDGIAWRAYDRGMRAFWRVRRALPPAPSGKAGSTAAADGVPLDGA